MRDETLTAHEMARQAAREARVVLQWDYDTPYRPGGKTTARLVYLGRDHAGCPEYALETLQPDAMGENRWSLCGHQAFAVLAAEFARRVS